MSSAAASSRESRWPELAVLRRALMARDAAVSAVVAPPAAREPRQQQPAGRRGGRDADHAAAAGSKRDKVMHLLLWGPK
nr:unnamed protein product [Digitaria exilis]